MPSPLSHERFWARSSVLDGRDTSTKGSRRRGQTGRLLGRLRDSTVRSEDQFAADRSRRYTTLGAALVSSLALWAALPPLGWSLLAWIAPLGWLWLIDREKLDGRHPYRTIWLAGFVFWMGALHWLRLPHWATSFGWVALSIYLGFYVPAFVALSRVAVHRLRVPIILAAPAVWTGLELLRGHLLGGFTMASLGHSQYLWPRVIQIADLVGAYGVSFVVMFVAACLFRMIWPGTEMRRGATAGTTDGPRRDLQARGPNRWLRQSARFEFGWLPMLPLGGMLAAVLVYGSVRQSMPPDPAMGPRVALIQGSIDTELKHDPTQRDRVFRQYFELSLRARAQRPHLIVWPETMYRDPLIECDADAVVPPGARWTLDDLRRAERESRRHLGEVARLLECDLLLGVDTQHYTSRGLDRYNSAVYVRRDGTLLGRYDKTHPVMFGEYIPLADVFPWLYRIAPLAGGIRAGQTTIAFDCQAARLAANICYESVLPQVILRQVRQLAQHGREPHVLVNLTNSGWYWGSSELDLHLACNVFRAVECRKPLLVAANTGLSAWIDGNGHILRRGPRRDTDVIVCDVRLDSRTSLYARFGDWFAGICLAGCVLLAGVGLWRPRREASANSTRHR